MRAVKCVLAGGVLAAGIAAYAQSATGWRLQSSNAMGDTIVHGSGAVVNALAVPTQKDISDEQAARTVARTLKECPGIATAPARKTANGRGIALVAPVGAGQCVVVTGHGNGKVAMALGLQKTSEDIELVKLAEFMAFNRLDARTTGQAGGAPALPAPPTGQTALGTNKSGNTKSGSIVPVPQPASLKAAINRIPPANRPIDMAYRSEWDSVSMSMSYVPWVLFADNIAVEADCDTWNYSYTPSRATISKNAIGCDVATWRKVGGSIKFDDDDPVDHGGFGRFAPGERISIAMRRQGGGSVSGGFASTSVISSGDLRMTPAGQIAIGSWSGVTTSGSNFTAYGSGNRGVQGTYYLDGFLMAVQDAAGRISIGFISRRTEGRDTYMIVNGKLYWK
jgi:hypothetical protein